MEPRKGEITSRRNALLEARRLIDSGVTLLRPPALALDWFYRYFNVRIDVTGATRSRRGFAAREGYP